MRHVVDPTELSARNSGGGGLVEIADDFGLPGRSSRTFDVDHDSHCMDILVRSSILGAWRSILSGKGGSCRWA
jgi:hypothetical protein